jgi:hypothetical protein
MYKSKSYQVRELEDIYKEIDELSSVYPQSRSFIINAVLGHERQCKYFPANPHLRKKTYTLDVKYLFDGYRLLVRDHQT